MRARKTNWQLALRAALLPQSGYEGNVTEVMAETWKRVDAACLSGELAFPHRDGGRHWSAYDQWHPADCRDAKLAEWKKVDAACLSGELAFPHRDGGRHWSAYDQWHPPDWSACDQWHPADCRDAELVGGLPRQGVGKTWPI